MTNRPSVIVDNKVYKMPYIGQRCPRCHHRAPRLDGIPCKLCAPTCGTYTELSGITHAYRTGCNPMVDLAGLKLKYFNVGNVPVTCMMCLATTVPMKSEYDDIEFGTV